VRWEKTLTRLASGFTFLLANPSTLILLAFSELVSGYPHPWCYATSLYFIASAI
jgi:hypothetical protein